MFSSGPFQHTERSDTADEIERGAGECAHFRRLSLRSRTSRARHQPVALALLLVARLGDEALFRCHRLCKRALLRATTQDIERRPAFSETGTSDLRLSATERLRDLPVFLRLLDGGRILGELLVLERKVSSERIFLLFGEVRPGLRLVGEIGKRCRFAAEPKLLIAAWLMLRFEG